MILWADNHTHVRQGKRFAQGFYFHGELQSINGDDRFDMEEADYEEIIKEGTGVKRVSVVLSNDKITLADMYFWETKAKDNYKKAKAEYDALIKQYEETPMYLLPESVDDAWHKMATAKMEMEVYPVRALVVLPYDKYGVADAKRKQKRRVIHL